MKIKLFSNGNKWPYYAPTEHFKQNEFFLLLKFLGMATLIPVISVNILQTVSNNGPVYSSYNFNPNSLSLS